MEIPDNKNVITFAVRFRLYRRKEEQAVKKVIAKERV